MFKTEKIKYAYLASLLSGFVLSCKLEFLSVAIILFAGLFLYKRLERTEYLKIIGFYFVFPVLTLLILLLQGVTFQDLSNAIGFAVSFSTTKVMRLFLSETGMSPASIDTEVLFPACIKFLSVFSLCALTIFLDEKFKKKFILPTMGLIPLALCCYLGNTENYWFELPVILLVFSLFFFKSIVKEKKLLFLCITAFILCIREFFRVCLTEYGTYSFPVLLLYLCALINSGIINREYLKTILQRSFNLMFIILIIINIFSLFHLREMTNFKLMTNRGNIYISYDRYVPMENLRHYFREENDNSSTILVLPEGNIINYLTEKMPDFHYFMMDRLYHDAYGEEKARDIIKGLNSDYIVLVEDFELNNFGSPYLYDKDETLSAKYISENYDEILNLQTPDSDTRLQLLKRKI